MTTTLGVSAYYHDSAAALLVDGRIVAAAQEERFSRIKHDKNLPIQSICYCLKEAKIDLSMVDAIVFYEKPFLTFERLLETYLSFAPRGFLSFCKAMPMWLKQKIMLKSLTKRSLAKTFKFKKSEIPPIYFSYHHLSHASSAFYPSPFESAAILCADGVGEWCTTSLWHADREKGLRLLKEIHFPHSLGLLYSAFTYHCGFKVNSGEYKLMGLAPYGRPIYKDYILEHLIDLKTDGSYRLNMKYFDFATGLKMTNKHFCRLFESLPRKESEPLTQKYMDLAASVQAVTEEVVLRLAKTLKDLTGEQNICLAGGVALNCVANGKLLQAKIFEDLWVQPAAGDAGGSLGAALAYWHETNRTKSKSSTDMNNAYLGPAFSNDEILSQLRLNEIEGYEYIEDDKVAKRIAGLLEKGKVVGWFQGRMEFGPRALGARSILADPRSLEMQSIVNKKIKFRESFRPLAPVVLKEAAEDCFVGCKESPYMIVTFPVAEHLRKELTQESVSAKGFDLLKLDRSQLGSVTHVDYSARVQTIDKKSNPKYYQVIAEFGALTGYPVLINTSFNVRGEPIVCNPQDAINCFKHTHIDCLLIENFLLEKNKINLQEGTLEWSKNFLPD